MEEDIVIADPLLSNPFLDDGKILKFYIFLIVTLSIFR